MSYAHVDKRNERHTTNLVTRFGDDERESDESRVWRSGQRMVGRCSPLKGTPNPLAAFGFQAVTIYTKRRNQRGALEHLP
jgi:hypothetical protein